MKKMLNPFLLAGAALVACALLPMAQAQAQCFPKMPMSNLNVTSNFGWRIHPIHKDRRLHGGIDLSAPLGTPVYAVEDGTVEPSRWSDSAGNMVNIRGNSGTITHNFHFNRSFVKTGQLVKMGQQIGEAGNTGASAGNHLHLEVAPAGKGKVDPRPFLCGLTGKADAATEPPTAPIGGSVSTAGIPNNTYPPMGSGASGAVPVLEQATQASSLGSYAGKSLYEFLATESSRRFSNPQWYRDISDPKDALRNDPDPAVRASAESIPIVDVKPMIWREIIFMMSLSDFYKMEKHERGERIEDMLATDLADRVNDYSTKLLGTLRSQATSR